MSLLLPPAGVDRKKLVFSYSLLLLLATAGFIGMWRQIAALSPPAVYEKDFTQEYLLARAVLDRANPYVPQPELAARYLPSAASIPQITPHPPFAALVTLPLPLVPLPSVALVASLLAGAIVLLSAGSALRASKDPALEWGVVVAAVLLLGPVTWSYYFVLLIQPLAFLTRRLYRAGWPRRRTNLYLLAFLVGQAARLPP